MPCRTFPQEAPVSVKEKILMLVVLGSRLAISCGLNHQSSSGSLTAFHLFPFEALGNVSFSVDNGTLKYRELRTLVEMVEVVVLVENIFSLALDFDVKLSYLDKRLMNVS